MTRLAVLLLPLTLAACSLTGKPPRVLATLTPAQMVPAGQVRTSSGNAALTVLQPGAPAALATVRIPVYAGAPTVTYVKDVGWNDVPARLMQQMLGEAVAVRTGRLVLDPRQTLVDPGLRLSGQLVRFGLDATSREAVVTFDATLIGRAGEVRTRRFEARQPIGEIRADTVAGPLNAAANEVAAAVADWL